MNAVMEWIGVHCYPIHSIPMDDKRPRGAKGGGSRDNDQRVRGPGHYNPGNATPHPEVRNLPHCVAGGAELEPPARAPHTVYVKTLYQLAGQT